MLDCAVRKVSLLSGSPHSIKETVFFYTILILIFVSPNLEIQFETKPAGQTKTQEHQKYYSTKSLVPGKILMGLPSFKQITVSFSQIKIKKFLIHSFYFIKDVHPSFVVKTKPLSIFKISQRYRQKYLEKEKRDRSK